MRRILTNSFAPVMRRSGVIESAIVRKVIVHVPV
jgi:hypothetical protein